MTVRIEKAHNQLRVEFGHESDQLPLEDLIFLCNILPGNRTPGKAQVIFDYKKLGDLGFRRLLSHLAEERHNIRLNAEARSLVESSKKSENVLDAAIKQGRKIKAHPPKNLNIPGLMRGLKKFQIPAVAHMINVTHSANFSVPGSGKTAIAISTFQAIRLKDRLSCIVVIGPRSSFAPWEKEYSLTLDGKDSSVRITGNKDKRIVAWQKAKSASLVLLNYHVATNDREKLFEFLSSVRAMLVLDESHHIKNVAEGKWSTTMRSIAPAAIRRVIMSGTPAPNSLADLWSQFEFLYPNGEVLGPKEEFLHSLDENDEDLLTKVRSQISPLFWRIKKTDLKLPHPSYEKVIVPLGPIQKAIYQALSVRILKDSIHAPTDIDRLREWRRAKMMRLLQAASNPSLLAKYSDEFRLPPLTATGISVPDLIDRYPEFEIPAKILEAERIVRKRIASDNKIIVWTYFVHNIRMLLKTLKDVSPLPLYGAIPLSEAESLEINREKIVDRFLNDPYSRVLIANPAACAESISLHSSCHEAIYLDRTFNCAQYLQSKDRIHRLGLLPDAEIKYYLLLAEGTIDEVVDQRLLQKEDRMISLLEDDLPRGSLEPTDILTDEADDEAQDFVATLEQLIQQTKDDR